MNSYKGKESFKNFNQMFYLKIPSKLFVLSKWREKKRKELFEEMKCKRDQQYLGQYRYYHRDYR